jgi:tRNA uridine 5-carboxymethylaminomethyl modification enzyme
MHNPRYFDVIVIGGGHAGIEASSSTARMGLRVALVTMDRTTIGRLSCNPSIGGSAKGHLATEIDALGGIMPRLADASGLQFKLLNTSKGPAVWSPRSQNDKDLYPKYAQHYLSSLPNLTIVQDSVESLIVKGDTVVGVQTATHEEIRSRSVILCSGTFLNGVMYTGLRSTKGGRVDERASERVSDVLSSYGVERGRLKTGTPPRIDAESVNFKHFSPHNGDDTPRPFSIYTHSVRNRLACWQTTTTPETHDILRKGFDRSPMFTGAIRGAGPRYCPSIEDKIDRFADKTSHPIVLEPEGLNTNSLYVNGFSTSLPEDIQDAGLRSIRGLEKARVLRYGYAVEYDFFYPYQLRPTLESKAIRGLFFAGQVNGTSGYEEAASQGLIAGINAALYVRGEGSFTLQRSQAYIGVLIDDLVNKNTEEPYRIFTSLAEYRLLLRIDTAYNRLLPFGYTLGLVPETMKRRWDRLQSLNADIENWLNERRCRPEEINDYLLRIDEQPVSETTSLRLIARRPAARLLDLLQTTGYPSTNVVAEHPSVLQNLETSILYEGYIQKLEREAARFLDYEKKRIPPDFEYSTLSSLSKEAREKLSKIRPDSLGQASRIPGVRATDIAMLALQLRS